MKKNLYLTLSYLLFSLSSCKSEEKKSIQDLSFFEEEIRPGFFRAILRPLNNQLSGYIPSGIAEVEITDKEFKVMTILDDDAPVQHLQSIHRGDRCPNLSDDLNADGIIDIQEAYSASGEVIMALDGSLDLLEKSDGQYPWGSGLTYRKKTSLSYLEKQMNEKEGLSYYPKGRVVLIHGVSKFTNLPPTVASPENMTPQMSIPIVCGVLK